MLVNENRLDEWVRGNDRDAQGVIVELVWRLVAASCPNPRKRRFPLGDSIGQHGPDGVLDAILSFGPWVPQGLSCWEIGTGQDAQKKATFDYKQLTGAVPESDRLDTTFVFVTPLSALRGWKHTWKEGAQANWLKKRCKRREWKDVQIIDGTTLIDWTHQFPAVELWLAEKLSGVSAEHIGTPAQRWHEVKSIGEPPPLTPDLFLASRSEAIDKLKEVLDATSMRLKLTTHYPDQVVDFVSAYLASLDDEGRVEAAGRCLIVSAVDAWNRVCSQYRDLFLVADVALDLSGDAGTKLVQRARKAGHAVIFGGPPGGIPDRASVPLPMPRRHQVQKALEKAGYSEERARTLAQKSGGNLGSLLRCIQNLSLMPEWAERAGASELAIAMVLGSWNDKSDSDCAVVEELVGKAYGEWIGGIREIALCPATPLIQRDGNWKFIPRYEGWHALGPRLFDEHLDRLKAVAVSALREKDPQFELPSEERFVASIHGKVLSHSRILRNGLAETLALLGSHPGALTNCSFGKAEATAVVAVREILADADWVLWASLNDLLPLLAEAAPGEFLNAVETALQCDPCPFGELFAQEGSGVVGRTYMSGLLWALETLAWDSDLLSRVVIYLGELAARDPGGQWANRPANSLNAIFLPWLPHTCAPIAHRVAAVGTLLTELSDIGWKLLASLLPRHHSVSSGTRRPAWRAIIPDDRRTGVTHREYWEQVSAYSELAIHEAKKDVSKLAGLIDDLKNLPQPAHDQLLDYLGSDAVLAMPEADRLPIWNQLVNLATEHRKLADAEWAMETEQVEKNAALADRLTPDEPFLRHQRVFSERGFELFEEKGNYEAQMTKLEGDRQGAVTEVAAGGGTEAVIAFATAVESPWRVGITFGAAASPDADSMILPALLESEQKTLAQLAGGFVVGRYRSSGWEWVYNIETSQWTPTEIGKFLSFLPFTRETWERAESLLGEDRSAYWGKISATPFQADGGLELAVDRLIEQGRPFEAIRCLHHMLLYNRPFDKQQAIRALLEPRKSPESPHSLDVHETVEIIKALQRDPDTNPADLRLVEWAYLPLLDEHHRASPKLLWRQLADDPKFFCEVIRLVFRSRKEERLTEEWSEEKKDFAAHAYRLLSKWRFPPGCRENGPYNGDALAEWLDAVKKECNETGHLEVAMTMVGHALVHTPPDADGLWIHRSAAAALNATDAGDMRAGFQTELLNSRGVHWVDPTGKPEKELAEKFRMQAETIESAGCPRLATTLRGLAKSYDREAERVSSRVPFDD